MIIRILGEGQFEVPEEAVDALNALDDEVLAAAEAAVEERFRSALGALLDRVREVGTPLPDDALTPSDAVLPPSDIGLEELQELLRADGLIPG